MDFPYFYLGARRHSAVQRDKHMQIQSLWYMNFSLITGCGTLKNNIRVSFEVVLVGSPNITIVTKKSKQTSVRKNS